MRNKKLSVLFIGLFSAGLLSLTACGDKAATQDAGTASAVVQSKGNWQAKAADLSTDNAADIKADLAALNPIVNQSNEKGIAIIKEVRAAQNDQAKVKTLLGQSMSTQIETEQKLLDLNLKSAEVQGIRTQMIDSAFTAKKLFEMLNKPTFDMAKPDAEFQALTKRSMAIQQRIGLELNALNQKHPQ